MTEIIQLIQQFVINQIFLVTLLFITINNINRKIDIKVPLKVIKFVLISSALISLIVIFSQSIIPDQKGTMIDFLKRATGPMKYNYLFMIFCATILPFSLFINKLGTNKYYPLCILNYRCFNIIDISIKYKLVDVLNNS